MSNHIIIVDQLKDWPPEFPEANVISTQQYLASPEHYRERNVRVINLSRSYRYLSTGYFCSLLAEARRQKVLPSVRTITNISSKAIYSLNMDDLDNVIQRILVRHARREPQHKYEIMIFFGMANDHELQELARQIFEIFPAPLLKVEFRRQQRWVLNSLKPVPINSISPDHRELFNHSLKDYMSSRWRKPKTRNQARYDIAILHDPDEKLPPSNRTALNRFVEAGKKLGADVELITRKDYSRLPEYDALLIRETTNINHHTYRFAKKAEAEGMAVIDDPDSIVKCTNKVYLAELLILNKVPTPRTLILNKGESINIEEHIPYPVVLKIPDGSFSRGVVKAENREQYQQMTKNLFRESDLILAQEYVYTDFDWRIGLLDNKVLFACKYLMSPKHWQIVRHDRKGRAREGGYQSLPLDEVPDYILKAARKAASLIGDGLYGVDIKERDGKAYVIEVNDNPNIESGVEDGILGHELYLLIIAELIRRLEALRNL
jgi:glutathione synthase/RimK-type ligase-like ATP-grasp enzyme